MLTMASQQEFLPTNLLIDTNTFGITLMGGVVLSLILMFAWIFSESKKLGFIFSGGFALTVVVSGVFLITSMNDIQRQESEVSATNQANLIKNIETVYDVDWVRVDGPVYSKESVEVFLSQDDAAYSALISQDPETFEPSVTLITGAEKSQELRKK